MNYTERKVINHMIDSLENGGWELYRAGDEESSIRVSDRKQAMKFIDTIDQATLSFRNIDKTSHTVLLVYGNDGYDVIADYGYSDSDNFSDIMRNVVTFALSLQQ